MSQAFATSPWVPTKRRCKKQKKHLKEKQRYEEILKMKLDFYQGLVTLWQQKFKQGKFSQYYAIDSDVDLAMWSFKEVLQVYNKANDNM